MATFTIINENAFQINNMNAVNENAKSAAIIMAAARVLNNENDIVFDFAKEKITLNEACRAKAIQIAHLTDIAKAVAEEMKKATLLKRDDVEISYVSICDFGKNEIQIVAKGNGTFNMKEELKGNNFKYSNGRWEKTIKIN